MLSTSPATPRDRALRAALLALPVAALSAMATPLGSMALGVLPLFALVPVLALSDWPATRARLGKSLGGVALALVADFLGLMFGLLATLTVFLMLFAALPLLLRPLWIVGAARLLGPLRSKLAAVLGLAILQWPTGYMAWTSGMAQALYDADAPMAHLKEPLLNPELWLGMGLVASAAWLGALAAPAETE